MEGIKRSLLVVVSILNLLCHYMSVAMAYSFNQTTPLVPAVIVFGDSIVDPGNNNDLKTPIICNFPPYGQDFYGHQPTGRFSNGKIPTDFMEKLQGPKFKTLGTSEKAPLIASEFSYSATHSNKQDLFSGLGIKDLLPPYVGYELSPEDILTGVSFASGATGFDPLTPVIVNVIPMTDQLKLFAEYKEKLKAIAGEERAAYIISEALYMICVGTDDIANTYFTTPFRVVDYDIPSYVDFLVSNAGSFIKELQSMGAKKIGYIGLPPIGCVPSQRTVGGGPERACEPKRNYAAQLYNYKIQEEIDRILQEPTSQGSKIQYIDSYNILLDIIERPDAYGFEEATKGCCGTGLIEVTKLCNSKTATTCSDVTKYVFWDSYHPTERAYKAIVNNIFDNHLHELI